MPAHARVTAALVVVLGGTLGGATRLPSEANAAGPEALPDQTVETVSAGETPTVRAFSDEDLRSLSLATSLGSGRAVPDVSAGAARTPTRQWGGTDSSRFAGVAE